jgi:hypothetical protein
MKRKRLRYSNGISHQWRLLSVLSLATLAGCALPALPPAPMRAYEQVSPEKFAAHVRFLADPALGGRATGTRGNAVAARYVAEQFAKAPLSPAGDDGGWFQKLPGGYQTHDHPPCNVIGRLACPAGPDAPTIVIGAHYDHLASRVGQDGNAEVFPGADDNASGVSVLILAAKALASAPDRRCNFVFVAFEAEEIGFVGSRHYVRDPAAPLARTAALINVDQVGYVRENRLFMIGSLLSPVINRALGRVRGRAKAGLSIVPVPTSNTKGWSDQAAFARLGLPTLFFYCGQTSYYHTPQDTADRVNNVGGAQVARLIFEVARALDHDFGQAPQWKVGVSPEKVAAQWTTSPRFTAGAKPAIMGS